MLPLSQFFTFGILVFINNEMFEIILPFCTQMPHPREAWAVK